MAEASCPAQVCVERVVQKGSAIQNLGVVGGDVRESLADRPESGGLRRAIDLFREVGAMDDASEPHQRGVRGETLGDELLEGAAALRVGVRIPRAGRVEADRALAL